MSVIKEKVVEEVKSILQNSWIWKCWFCDVFKLIDLVHKCSVFDYMAEDEIDFVHCFVIENFLIFLEILN